MRTFFIAALAEFVSFLIIVVNTRAFTHALIGWTVVTDALFITQSFAVQKWMVEQPSARGWAGYFGFLVGGTLGSVTGILVSKYAYGL